MIDTHCHLTFRNYTNKVKAVLDRAEARGVHGAITVSTTTQSALECLALARHHDRIWSSAGVHPLHADEPANWDDMLGAAADDRCVALGELGLDRHYAEPALSVQESVLDEQLALIVDRKLSKPIIVHCREAFDEVLGRFAQSGIAGERFVFHCFTGGPEEARRVLDLGAMISFTGIVTFKNAAAIQAAAKLVPDDRIMVETDAPFLTPEPHRKVYPNEPCYAMDTARFLAELRGQPWDHFHQAINANTHRFFGIDAH